MYSDKHQESGFNIQVADSNGGNLAAVGDPIPGARHDAHAYAASGLAARLADHDTLGDKGWDKLFPGEGGAKVTWTEYREKFFNDLVKAQNKDGSWTSHQGGFGVGPVYSTAIYCTIMQLDKGTLPIYQR